MTEIFQDAIPRQTRPELVNDLLTELQTANEEDIEGIFGALCHLTCDSLAYDTKYGTTANSDADRIASVILDAVHDPALAAQQQRLLGMYDMLSTVQSGMFPRLDEKRAQRLNSITDAPLTVIDDMLLDFNVDGLVSLRRNVKPGEDSHFWLNITRKGKAALKGFELYKEEVLGEE